MEFEKTAYKVDELVSAWKTASLRRNPEYQRGEAWSLAQKQALIDSIFRAYPIPPLFLQKLSAPGLGGDKAIRYDVVDGQQRLLSLSDYLGDRFALLDTSDKRLKIPSSLRGRPAPWAKKHYSELAPELQLSLADAKLDVYLLSDISHPDEVRDLFIRLQSGTALTRQQVRDAWPGNIGPYIERLAGKLQREPSEGLFRLVDKRGQKKDDDERDRFVGDRQTCAQLLWLFLAREFDPRAFPSVSANQLDALYHEYTEFDETGDTGGRFGKALQFARAVVARASDLSNSGSKRRTKFKKLDVIALVLFFQDVTKLPGFRFDSRSVDALARRILEIHRPFVAGRSTSGRRIAEHYEWWRSHVAGEIGIRLDPTRAFSDQQKAEIHARQQGMCAICKENVEPEDAEYDHYPIPYRDGGPTGVNNGRLVHRTCHPRGRLVEVGDE
jgi:hypothetical protein